MSKEELQSLTFKNRFSESWVKAFAIYNEDHPNEKPLHPNCTPCFFKVRQYVIDKFSLKFAKA